MSLKTFLVQGKASYCKILGNPVPGYEPLQKEWTFDLILDEAGKEKFLASGADPFYLKEGKDGEEYVRFTRRAIKKDGSESKPISVVGPDGVDWDQSVLIGNGSVLNVKFSLNSVKSQGMQRLKPSVLAVQVWEHTKYKGKSDFPVRETNSNITHEDSWA